MLKHIQDLEELFALGYFFEPTEPAVLNHIPEAMKEKKMTVLLIEQNANAALDIADRGYVMETGRMVLEEDAGALKSNQEVKRAYLGKDQKEIWE